MIFKYNAELSYIIFKLFTYVFFYLLWTIRTYEMYFSRKKMHVHISRIITFEMCGYDFFNLTGEMRA